MKFIGSIISGCLFGAVVVSAAPKPVGTNPCTYGPSYWCASFENAKKCNYDISNCKKYCDSVQYKTTGESNHVCLLVGFKRCTQGPEYWCASKVNAEHCGFNVTECEKYCDNKNDYPDIQKGDVCSKPVGGNPCSRGPSYWCGSKEHAKECGVTTNDCQKYCNNTTEYPSIQNGSVCTKIINLEDVIQQNYECPFC